MIKHPVIAIALFSGGLDSILSCRVIQEQGVRVLAVRFVTPFFGLDLLARANPYTNEVRQKYGIEVEVRDVSEGYLTILANPCHGYGKNFNPCVDCKVFLAGKAREFMAARGGSFIITGEVLGQRPMSQRRDTLRIVERDSGCDGILLRPLSARHLNPTRPEQEGLVDRERLLGFTGRGRTDQIALATRFGIVDYPASAGGCVLTDPILSGRIRRFFAEARIPPLSDIHLLLFGRHFLLPGGGWLIMGRDRNENEKIEKLGIAGDLILSNADDWPGPTAILRRSRHPDDIRLAAGILVRYGKKRPSAAGNIGVLVSNGLYRDRIIAPLLADEQFRPWVI